MTLCFVDMHYVMFIFHVILFTWSSGGSIHCVVMSNRYPILSNNDVVGSICYVVLSTFYSVGSVWHVVLLLHHSV